MDNEELDGVKFSEFPSQTPVNADEVVGLHSGDNARFSIANIVAAVRNGLASIFVPLTRTVNGKGLSTDISLDSSDIDYDNTGSGLAATNVQDAIDEVYGDIPTQASDIGAQPTITASGILKGDGAGGVSAATAGTDYGTYSKPSGGIPASDLASGVIPTVPSAYTSNPAMDGTASPGSTGAWADGGHVHPSDTTKANQAQLTYVETGTTASRAYDAGEFFCWNGLLYRVTTAISSGGTFTPGTNCEEANGFNSLPSSVSKSISANTSVALSLVSGHCYLLVVGNVNRISDQSAVYILTGNPSFITLKSSSSVSLSSVSSTSVTVSSSYNNTVTLIDFKFFGI